MYEIFLTYREGTDREEQSRELCNTLEAAATEIESWAFGRGDYCRAWINGKEVRISAGCVIGDDGEPFCTNEKWHEVFAPLSQQVRPLTGADYTRAVLRNWEPRPVATNPATPSFGGEGAV